MELMNELTSKDYIILQRLMAKHIKKVEELVKTGDANESNLKTYHLIFEKLVEHQKCLDKNGTLLTNIVKEEIIVKEAPKYESFNYHYCVVRPGEVGFYLDGKNEAEKMIQKKPNCRGLK